MELLLDISGFIKRDKKLVQTVLLPYMHGHEDWNIGTLLLDSSFKFKCFVKYGGILALCQILPLSGNTALEVFSG